MQVINITKEISQPISFYNKNIQKKQYALYESLLKGNKIEHLFSLEQNSQEITGDGFFDFKIFTGEEYNFHSLKTLTFYNCFFSFSYKIQIIAPKIHIGNCFFIPRDFSASIEFKCPDDIETSLDRIEFIAREKMFFNDNADDLSKRDLSSDSSDLCDIGDKYGQVNNDLSIHFEGWIDFEKYKKKTDAIYLTFNKNWFVRFYYRS